MDHSVERPDTIGDMLSLLLMLLSSTALAGSPVLDAMRAYLQHAVVPVPPPTAEQAARIEAGEVVKIRLPGTAAAPDGAMVLVASPLSRQACGWARPTPTGKRTACCPTTCRSRATRCSAGTGWWTCPGRFSDRHFLIRTTVNRALSAAQPGMWARSWELEPGGQATMRARVAQGAVAGLDAERFDAAIYVPVNEGSWLFLDLPDGRTLFGYHATSALGGDIPDNLVSRYVMWGLDEIVRNVLERAERMEQHYVAGHRKFIGGDGQPIPHYSR